MLFTDSLFPDTEILAALDPQAPRVAQTAGIVLDGPYSVIQAAYDECVAKFMVSVQCGRGGYAGAGACSGHLAAVFDTGGDTQGFRIGLRQVVMTPTGAMNISPLQNWLAYTALAILYERAVDSKGSADTYVIKAGTNRSRAETAFAGAKSMGIPVVQAPLERPAAAKSDDPGEWGADDISTAAGNMAAGDWEVAVTYVNGYATSNNESAPTDRALVTLDGSHDLVVSIARLRPPTGGNDILGPSMAATHWNIYAGASGGVLRLMNANPIPIATTSAKATEITGPVRMTSGQKPDTYFHLFEGVLRA
jgi:hypothetical protein